MKAIIYILQAESDRWLAKYSESPDPEITDLPCLDTFLRMHMMQVRIAHGFFVEKASLSV
jgi:hypothetical protein